MRVRLSTVTELKEIFSETLLNNTNKVSKITDNSVLNGISFGVGKIGQKTIKEVALVEAHMMVDSAYGVQLDDVADSKGVAPRFGASQSSTFIRVVGDPGTTYTPTVHTFSGSHGQVFDVEESITIGSNGFGYVKVRSQDVGANQNVDPLTLVNVTPEPTGHQFCVNEYGAFGGRDQEQDEVFRKRIKEGGNLAATSTLSKLTQIMNKINSDVLKVVYQGMNVQSQVILGVITQNGIDLTGPELNDIEVRVQEFLAISDLKPFGAVSSSIQLRNVQYQPIDITFRVELNSSLNPDLVRKDIQVQFSKYLDFRFWTADKNVQWDELLSIVRNTQGVKSVPDTRFIPNKDVVIDNDKLPRIRSVMMLDLDGNIISNATGTLNPVFYPSRPDSSFQQTILATI